MEPSGGIMIGMGRALAFVLLGLWIPGAARAQAVTTAAIYGAVSGADSAGIEEAIVSVTNTATGERWQVSTRAGGRYYVEYLSLGGPYTVEARAIGFQPTSRPAIVLSLAERERVDFQLISSIVTLPEIAVSAAADDRINPGRTGPAQTFTDTLISRLPVVRRNFYHLIQLSPQAAPSPAGGASIAGQNDRLNGLQIDGGSNNDLSGYAGGGGIETPGAGVRTLSVEAIRELQVATAPFDVRFGTFAAGLINVVTRSGLQSLGRIALRLCRGRGAHRQGRVRRPGAGLHHEGAGLHGRRSYRPRPRGILPRSRPPERGNPSVRAGDRNRPDRRKGLGRRGRPVRERPAISADPARTVWSRSRDIQRPTVPVGRAKPVRQGHAPSRCQQPDRDLA